MVPFEVQSAALVSRTATLVGLLINVIWVWLKVSEPGLRRFCFHLPECHVGTILIFEPHPYPTAWKPRLRQSQSASEFVNRALWGAQSENKRLLFRCPGPSKPTHNIGKHCMLDPKKTSTSSPSLNHPWVLVYLGLSKTSNPGKCPKTRRPPSASFCLSWYSFSS